MATTSKSSLGDDLRSLQAGINANLHAESLIVGGATLTGPQAAAQIDTFIAAQTATVNAKAAYHTAVTQEKTSDTAARLFRSQFQAYLVSRYGKTNPILQQFGFTPTKAKKTTAAVKAVAVLKLKATRKARGTMSKKQKAKIKGTVDPSIAASLTGEAVAMSAEVAMPAQAGTTPMAAVATAVPAVASQGAAHPGVAEGHGQ